jgi:hypothetical protein
MMQAFADRVSDSRAVAKIDATFLRRSGVREISVDGDSAHFDTIDGCLVTRDGKTIVGYFGNDRDFRIGANVETVGEGSFGECEFSGESHSRPVRS